jgi:hypothetical protein
VRAGGAKERQTGERERGADQWRRTRDRESGWVSRRTHTRLFPRDERGMKKNKMREVVESVKKESVAGGSKCVAAGRDEKKKKDYANN